MGYHDRIIRVGGVPQTITFLGSGDGRFYIAGGEDIVGFPPETRFQSFSDRSEQTWFPAAFSGLPDLGEFSRGIAHWFLITAFIPFWASWLILHGRRLKYYQKLTSSPAVDLE